MQSCSTALLWEKVAFCFLRCIGPTCDHAASLRISAQSDLSTTLVSGKKSIEWSTPTEPHQTSALELHTILLLPHTSCISLHTIPIHMCTNTALPALQCTHPLRVEQGSTHTTPTPTHHTHTHGNLQLNADSASLLSTWSWLNFTKASYCSETWEKAPIHYYVEYLSYTSFQAHHITTRNTRAQYTRTHPNCQLSRKFSCGAKLHMHVFCRQAG